MGAQSQATPDGLRVEITFSPEQLDALAERVADVLEDRRDEGFIGVDGAAEFLARSAKAIYQLVERRRIPHHRAGGRLLFDRRELREWVERGEG
jgi:excisionase family DNA binding protein